MSKLLMLAGGIVGNATSGTVSAYVVLSAGTQSRVFKVTGDASAPQVTELAAATTLDVQRFQRELAEDLPSQGAGMTKPDAAWVCAFVSAHLARG